MNIKENILSIIRHILVAVGAYLVGKNFLGNAIDAESWQGWVGAAITAISVVWGVIDKTATIEMVQSGLRSVVTFVGTMLVASGKIKGELLTSLLAIISIGVPMLYSQLSIQKSKKVASGTLPVTELRGVDANKQNINPKA